ncbi:hypothetical protein AR158_c352L [Paramecium bursaria Chlorella virus AR158]|uniref:hypothetical protein n=1 Tax=Paramecium bursaria Chlorella virus AR158 TaxID=380598 RepID=UPI00015AA947|nr:hypothetical protein AR158_c352L [Paramecium bursaria Chlorella virus AR158]ABU43897.1 hypothetical protein AR158_c352L [Paramecium bursaria Chlorella virus AR158]
MHLFVMSSVFESLSAFHMSQFLLLLSHRNFMSFCFRLQPTPFYLRFSGSQIIFRPRCETHRITLTCSII